MQNQNYQPQINTATALLSEFGKKYNISVYNNGVNSDEVANVLIQTCFKKTVTPAQMAALLIVAKQYNLNPFTREIYAYPDKNGGIVPIVGVDGWCNMVNCHSEYAGMEFRYSESSVELFDKKGVFAHEWVECLIYRNDRSKPIVVREYLTETYKSTGPWQSHPNRMLRHKTLIQCARYAFGFTGVYDPDEVQQMVNDNIIEGEFVDQTAKHQQAHHEQAQAQQTQEQARTQQTQDQAPQDGNVIEGEYTEQKQDAQEPENTNPPMPEDRFQANFEKSFKLISTGKKTAQEIIATLESSYSLTQDQKDQILQLESNA